MPLGSLVEITLSKSIGTLFYGLSGSQADNCWVSEKYSDCSVSEGTVTISFT